VQVSPAVARLAAGLVATVAWAALAAQFTDSLMLTDGSIPAALASMLRFFTVITNLLAAIVLTALALGARSEALPSLLGGVTVSIIVVGVVFAILLTGLRELSEVGMIADTLLHRATPILVAIYWLTAAPKGRLTRRDPLLWVLYPLAYCVYAMARGAADGIYAYPFLDYPANGWAYVTAHMTAIAAGFVALGYGLVWLDQHYAKRANNTALTH